MAGLPNIAVLACAVLIGTRVAAELLCVPSNSSEMRVTFDSHRNKTGRWTHAVGLEHRGLPRGPMHSQDPVPRTVDVKYDNKNCDETSKDSLKVEIYFSESLYSSDYVFIPGLGYYKYYSTLVTWHSAKATCEQDGAHLAILNSQLEAESLKKLVVNTGVDWAWIGLVKSAARGEFVTVNDDLAKMTGYYQWSSVHSPANAAPNSAAVINKNSGLIGYDQNPSKINYVFICEQDL